MIDVSFFKEHGYQVLRNFLPQDVLYQTYDFLVGEKENTLKKIHERLSFSSEQELIKKTGKLLEDPDKFNALDGNLKQWLSGHYPLEVRLSPALLALLENPQIQDLYQEMFPQEDPKVHLPPVLRFVLPNNPYAAVPPHQDVSYNKHIEEFFVMWVPFTSIDAKRGGVEIFEGTGNYPEQLENLDREFWLKGLEIKQKPIHFEMEVGDVLLLNRFIIHQSRANLSDEVRISGDFRFFSGTSSKHFLNLATNKRHEPSL